MTSIIKKYIYIGSGPGIPGLPHVLTSRDIALLDPRMAREFEAALRGGKYRDDSPQPSISPKRRYAKGPKVKKEA